MGLRFTANGSAERNDIQVQPTTSYPESPTAPDIRVGCRLEYPYSEGLLTLTSTDVGVQPHLDFRFLTDPRDTDRFRDAVRRTCDVFEHPAFADLLAERCRPPMPTWPTTTRWTHGCSRTQASPATPR